MCRHHTRGLISTTSQERLSKSSLTETQGMGMGMGIGMVKAETEHTACYQTALSSQMVSGRRKTDMAIKSSPYL